MYQEESSFVMGTSLIKEGRDVTAVPGSNLGGVSGLQRLDNEIEPPERLVILTIERFTSNCGIGTWSTVMSPWLP